MELYCINDIHINSYIPSTDRNVIVAKYKNFLAEHTLPADVLVIGGDIANDVFGAVSLLVAAARMFDKVIWIPGNSDYRCWNKEHELSTASKLFKIDTFVRTMTKAGQVIRLDGNTTTLEDLVVAGAMGMSDAKWFAKNDEHHSKDHIQAVWETTPYRYWNLGGNDFEQISKTEISRFIKLKNNNPDYVVSHFAPSNLVRITNQYPNIKSKAPKHFLAFNAKELTDSLKDGAIYHFGHLHLKMKQTVKNNNGEFLLINNSIGRKTDLVDNPKRLTKKDFLLTF